MRKTAAILLIAALVAIPCAALAKGYAEGYSDGRRDGWEDVDAVRHFVAGFGLSLIWFGYVLLSPPDAPPEWRIAEVSDETNEYQQGYIAGYERGWQSRRLVNTVYGASVWGLVVYVVAYWQYI